MLYIPRVFCYYSRMTDFEEHDTDDLDDFAGLPEKTQKKRKRMLDFLKALEDHEWNIAAACRVAKVNRRYYYEWLKTDEWFAERIDECKQTKMDIAEQALYQQVLAGNTSATMFYLKCHGKERGYVEKDENTEREIIVKWPELSPSTTAPTLDSSESTNALPASKPSDAADAGEKPTD